VATVFLSKFKALVIELAGETEKKFRRNPHGRIRVRSEMLGLAVNATRARWGGRKK